MTRFLSPTLLGVVLAMGWFWLRSHDAQVRAETLADVRADSLAHAKTELATIQGARAIAESLAVVRIQRLTDSLATQRRQFARASRETQRLTGQLDSVLADSTVPDSVVVIVNQTVTAFEDQVASCTLALRTCEAIVAAKDSSLARRDSTVGELTALLESTEALLATERSRASPGFLTRLSRSLPFVAVGIVGWELLR